jgi:hypothetical protein
MEYRNQIALLTDILIHEITMALALPQSRLTRQLVRLTFSWSARRFAEISTELDQVVAGGGVAAGARWILPLFVKDYSAQGVENIRADGPLIIASNHPAGYDSLIISAHINRPDYKIIIGEIPFFKYLPNVYKNAIFVSEPNDVVGRMKATREIIRHLKNNGALLSFAHGDIEPDPAWMPQPEAEFAQWSRSLEIFLRQVPHTQVLVTMVSGVIAKAAMRHPMTWFRRARPDRQRLAFMYQFIRQMIAGRELFGLTPRVTFGDLVSAENTRDRADMLRTITQVAHHVLKIHMAPTLFPVASDSLRQV